MTISREELIERKKLELTRELELWARLERLLNPGEQIAFTFWIQKIPTVVSDASHSLLDVTLEQFFTKERIREAGVLGHHDVRIYNAFANSDMHPKEKKVKDLVGLNLEIHFRRTGNIGKRSFEAIKATLKHNGIKI